MAIKITDDCINCHACVPECPHRAIYEPGDGWAMQDGTAIRDYFVFRDGNIIDAIQIQPLLSDQHYYIVPEKCTECQGFHEIPLCEAVYPVDCCVPDELYRETLQELLAKKEKLHI